MSGMSSMLDILLYRDGPSHHEPKMKTGTAARDVSRPEELFPLFNRLVARGAMPLLDGILSMLLMPLM
jgi:hypothetical protein